MRYWLALAYLNQNYVTGVTASVSLQDLSDALGCTRRNVQLLIKKLATDKVITWQPGIGRGNLPQLTINLDLEEMLTAKVFELLADNRVQQALELVAPDKQDSVIARYIADQKRSGGEQDLLRIPFYRGTHSLDVIHLSRRTEAHIADHIYAKLIAINPENGELEGDLAAYWQLEGKQLQVTLRKGLSFHDNSPLRSEDVKAHFERLCASDCAIAPLYQLIDRFEIQSPYHLTISSDVLGYALPKLMAEPCMGIAKFTNKGVVGSGAFYLAEQTDRRTLLMRFIGYHGYRPWIDGVEIWNLGEYADTFMPDSDIAHSHQTDGQPLDYLENTQWERGAEYVLLNTRQNAWLQDTKQRLAIWQMLKHLSYPKSKVFEDCAAASGMTSQPSAYLEPNLAVCKEWAKGLLRPDKPLTILTYQLSHHIELAHYYANALTRLGLPSKVKVVEFPDFDKEASLNAADLIVSGEVFGVDTELSWLAWLYGSRALQCCLTSRMHDELDTKLAAAMGNMNDTARVDALGAIEQSLKEWHVYLPVFHVKQQLNVSSELSAPKLLANGWIDFRRVTRSAPLGAKKKQGDRQ